MIKFKPITEKYHFDDSLVHDYPSYLRDSLTIWIKSVLMFNSVWHQDYGSEWVDPTFVNELNLLFRETFPNNTDSFIYFIFQDTDRTTNILGLCLQNYATKQYALDLEKILSVGGSAFSVMIEPISNNYQTGIANLVQRVPMVVLDASEEALNSESLLKEAWIACYSKNPNYEKTVTRSVDVLEGLLRDKYFPKDLKPVLTRFVKDLSSNHVLLSYKGDTLINPKSAVTDLAKEFITVRGQHTKGTGRIPTKEEAEFILHYVIFVWNLHR
jgi:hypothetical protein